ncbi:PREDICTED: sorting nexin-20 [Dipodomys ordii]|uniref:Sorting nexin-20 n=1 Tax=Dipodomys ordii TaxID=10020 RepID=A0A1S3G3F6_DIPOR|nr:PREDICTED: sorting nexin-20 [Dipodomys ordii]
MERPEHPESPGWTGPVTLCTTRTRQEAPATGPDLLCVGPDGHLDALSGPSSNSSMTTRELQESWQKEKGHWKPVKLLFEIASARIEERKLSKIVLYQIVVVQTGSFDSGPAVVERRYSDFEQLHRSLRKAFAEEMEDVAFPRKRLAGALRCLQARESHRYYGPLLDAMVHLAYALGKDFVSLQARLEESRLRRPADRSVTLKELTVREYLP